MKAKFGTICILLGVALLLGALALFLRNTREDSMAGEAAEILLPQLIEQIETRAETVEKPLAPAVDIPEELLTAEDIAMTEVEIDGYGYIGYLTVPDFGLELPVMGDWDYDRLKIAPCRYYGSTKSDDLVIMAHNYRRHFSPLSAITEGAPVVFTDMDGVVSVYEVVAIDFLSPDAVEEMTAGTYDLVLFTCTYGGGSRLTICCDRTE